MMATFVYVPVMLLQVLQLPAPAADCELEVTAPIAVDDEVLDRFETHPKVNGEFPWGISSSVWPSLPRALPPLPRELEYRFSHRDLVLLDTHANLVVDILEDALPEE